MLEKGPLFLIRFNEMKARLRRNDRHRDRRQPATAPEIEHVTARLQNLRRRQRLRDVIVEMLARLGTDEVDLLVPGEERLFVCLE